MPPVTESSWANTSCGQAEIAKTTTDRVGYTTPGYAELKKSGAYIKPLPYYVYESSRLDPIHLWGWTPGQLWYSGTIWSCFGGVSSSGGSFQWNDLASKLMDKVDEAEVSAAMTWFERKDTFSMLTKRALMLAKAARLVRKGKFKKASKALGVTLSQRKHKRMRKRNRLDQFSENWLEYRYGWTPLYHDFYNASELIADGLNGRDAIISIKTSEKYNYQGGVIMSGGCVCDNGESTLSGRHGLGLDFSVLDTDYRMRNALGLTNPHLVAWELVPFSFVADWFVNVGDSLRQLTAYKGLKFWGGYEYWKETTSIKVLKYTKAVWGTQMSTAYSDVTNSFRRVALSGFNDLLIDPWSTGPGLNAVRALDAVTLLHQVFKSR